MLFAGPAGTLTHAFAVDDGRRINREAKLRFMNAVSQFTGHRLRASRFPTATRTFAPADAVVGRARHLRTYTPLAPGDYDLYLRQSGTTTLLSGPTRISVAAGGIYGVLAVDGPDTATAAVLFLDDFP